MSIPEQLLKSTTLGILGLIILGLGSAVFMGAADAKSILGLVITGICAMVNSRPKPTEKKEE